MLRQTAASPRTGSYNWLRIGGLSGTLSIHFGALLVLAIPVALPMPAVSVPVETMIRVFEKPAELPTQPIPDEPQPVRLPPRRPSVSPRKHSTTPNIASDAAIPVAIPQNTPALDIAVVSEIVETPPSREVANVALAYESVTEPRYPPDAKRRGEQGVVLLRVSVGSNGLPLRIDVARSSGSFRLDRAAREAVLRWRFRPVQIDGRAVPAEGLVPVAFRLDRA